MYQWERRPDLLDSAAFARLSATALDWTAPFGFAQGRRRRLSHVHFRVSLPKVPFAGNQLTQPNVSYVQAAPGHLSDEEGRRGGFSLGIAFQVSIDDYTQKIVWERVSECPFAASDSLFYF